MEVVVKAQVNSDIGITQHGKYDGSIGAGEMVAEKKIYAYYMKYFGGFYLIRT